MDLEDKLMSSKKRKVISAILASTVIMSQYSVVTFAEEASAGSTEGTGETQTDYANGVTERGTNTLSITARDNTTHYYSDLAKAVGDAKAGDTVKLLDNMAVATKISQTENITIDLGNFTINATNNSEFYLFSIKDSVKLTIKNGTLKADAWLLSVIGNSELTLDKVSITDATTEDKNSRP